MNPVYKLPSFTYVPPDPPKFIRDAMIIDDIEGSRPLKPKEFAPRDTLNCFDIFGAVRREPYQRKRLGQTHYENICYDDVTKKVWQSKRHTNPLNPTY